MKFEWELSAFADIVHYKQFLIRLIHPWDVTGVWEDVDTSREFIALVIR
jgi:hypothetical protein